MSKMNLSRCAAVGIAGLTAMSSVAIVASAATQASVVYELQNNGIDSILLKTDVASKTYDYLIISNAKLSATFSTSLSKLTAEAPTYNSVAVGTNNVLVTNPATVTAWDATDFTGVGSHSMDNNSFEYKTTTPTNPLNFTPVKLTEVYALRTGTNNVIAFKSETERSNAKNTMITDTKAEYTALATPACNQFRMDINAAAQNARERLGKERDTVVKNAQDAYNQISVKTANDTATYNATIQTANNKYTAALQAINLSSSKIIAEFTSVFSANSYNYELGFVNNNAPVEIKSGIGGIGIIAGAEYHGLGGNYSLVDAKYWGGSTVRDKSVNNRYLFAGEIQPNDNFTVDNSFLYIGNTSNWYNYQVLSNDVSSGGNTAPDGGTNTGSSNNNNSTTTVTTWYPDSASYRSASDVSYLGQNGNWYTSATAATVYGGGYTGTSKASNYSSVNTSTNKDAIYFDSTTGTYSTTSTSYSYVVKEASESSNSDANDPYYWYFGNGGIFGNNSNNNTSSAPAGSPAINGTRYAGWTNISNYISSRGRSGTSLTINMNEGAVVPSAVLSAAKSKNVTLVFKNNNGSTVTVRPSTSMAGNDLNTTVTYNVKTVKSSLVNKAKSINDAVSSAQIKVGSDVSLGGTATVNVKFGTNRSGYTVKAYRYTGSSLHKEATGTINDSGRVNLNLTKGGNYVLVVCR